MSASRVTVFVNVDGTQISGLLQVSIATKNCFSADSFSITLALGQVPLTDLEYWSSNFSIYIEITVSADPGPTSLSLITGFVDTISFDLINQTVAIEGRDLSSTLIDSYRQQDFVNQTASEVVATIAQAHNLIPAVTKTSGSVGRYYGDGYTRLSLGQFSRLRSDWDLVVQLARENSFDVFVQGERLYFQPAVSFTENLVEIAVSDVREMRIERTLGIASGSSARVQSWNSQNMVSLDSDSAAGSGVSGEPTMAAETSSFLFAGSNLTPSQVAGSAARYTSELGRLATVLRLEMPWDLGLAPRQNILLSGTGSALDSAFRIESIERHYSSTTGSSQTIHAVLIS